MKTNRYIYILFSVVTLLVFSSMASASPFSFWNKEDKNDAMTKLKRAYDTLVIADEARDSGRYDTAIGKYQDALVQYRAIAKDHPKWEEKVVKFRTLYCEEQLSVLNGPSPKVENSKMPRGFRSDDPPVPPPVLPQVSELNPDVYYSGSKEVKKAVAVLLRKREGVKARDMILDELKVAPKDIELRQMIGIAYCQLEEYDKARRIAAQIVADDKTDPNARMLLSTAYLGLGDTIRAEVEAEIALELDPMMHQAHYNLAQLLLMGSSPNLEKAQDHYMQSVRLGGMPDPEIELRLKMDE